MLRPSRGKAHRGTLRGDNSPRRVRANSARGILRGINSPWFEVLKGFCARKAGFFQSFFSPPDRKGLLDFMMESAFAMLLHHAPTQYPARSRPASARAARQWIPPSIPPAGRQWIPPSIPPEQLASGAEYPGRAARLWIPPSIPPERLASGSRQVFCQSGSPVDPAKYSARAARQWIPPRILPE